MISEFYRAVAVVLVPVVYEGWYLALQNSVLLLKPYAAFDMLGTIGREFGLLKVVNLELHSHI